MNRPLPPRVLQIIGLTMLVGFVIYWVITGRQSALLVGAAGSLILAAQYEQVRDTLRDATNPDMLKFKKRPPPAPPAEDEC